MLFGVGFCTAASSTSSCVKRESSKKKSGARWDTVRLKGRGSSLRAEKLILRGGAMRCLKSREQEKWTVSYDVEEGDWTAGRSERGEKKRAVQEVRCSGQSPGCSCRVVLNHICVITFLWFAKYVGS